MKKTLFTMIAFTVLISFQQIANAQEVNTDLVRVFRWMNTVDNNFVTLADGEIQEGQLLQWKYKEKTFLFYAYRTPGPDRVAVYRWTNPVTKDQASIAEDEFSDSDMQQKGYTLKALQYYAPIRRAQNHIPVYNWYKSKSKDWVTIPEFGDTDKYWDKGYKQKKFQYYGVMRNEYEK
ncbi:MAG: hypothetical protein IPJ31_07240 [Bacteroidetes bacterium]|nr:hypothetical protein [Bacteroidota bacterium]MBP6314438.1 hypothetical protein [Chitinophagaceae bacterium]